MNSKTIFLIIMLFYCNDIIYAQNIEKLDAKNGFKDLTLGDDISKWYKNLLYLGEQKDGSLLYKFTGNCCKKVFEFDVRALNLSFYQSKLVGIYIQLENFQDYSVTNEIVEYDNGSFDNLRSEFRILFGKETKNVINSKSENPRRGSGWVGKRAMLFIYYDWNGTLGHDYARIKVVDRVFEDKVIKNRVERGF